MWVAPQPNKVNLRQKGMTDFHETWYVGTTTRHKCYQGVLPIWSVITKCAYWLIILIKAKYPEFCVDYSDETWYIGSARDKCYQ